MESDALSGDVAAARALLSQMETDAARLVRLKREAERLELALARRQAALDALAPTLPDALRAEVARRAGALRREADRLATRRASTAHQALVELVAAWERPIITVAEAQACLEAQGHATGARTYASGTLAALQSKGYVAKAGRAVYRINRGHPDIAALRLAALEREMAGWDGDAALEERRDG
jgi:hypothetical protein